MCNVMSVRMAARPPYTWRDYQLLTDRDWLMLCNFDLNLGVRACIDERSFNLVL